MGCNKQALLTKKHGGLRTFLVHNMYLGSQFHWIEQGHNLQYDIQIGSYIDDCEYLQCHFDIHVTSSSFEQSKKEK